VSKVRDKLLARDGLFARGKALKTRVFVIVASIVTALTLAGCLPLPPASNNPGGSSGGGTTYPPGNQTGGNEYNALPCPWVELDPYYVNGKNATRINVATIYRMWLEQTSADVTQLFMTEINDNRRRTIAGCRGNHCPGFMEETRSYVDTQIVRKRAECGYTN